MPARVSRRASRPNPPPTGVTSVVEKLALTIRAEEVLRLRNTTGATFAEVGRQLGISWQTARLDYVRALDAMRERLGQRVIDEQLIGMIQRRDRAIREFEASKASKVRRRMQRATPPGAKGAEPMVTELQQMDETNEAGDPKFLELALRWDQSISDALGLTGRARKEEDQPAQAQPGLVSGPIIEVSATVLETSPAIKAAIARVDKAEKQRLLKAATQEEKESVR